MIFMSLISFEISKILRNTQESQQFTTQCGPRFFFWNGRFKQQIFEEVQEVVQEVVQVSDVDEVNDELEEVITASYARHCSKTYKEVKKGKSKGKEVVHFGCKYCNRVFQGPSSSAFLVHLRAKHPTRCPELLTLTKNKPNHLFFNKSKMKGPFSNDVFTGKLLKWIVKTDQSFLIVDTDQFEDLLEYLKEDITVHSRRTLMRRMEEMYNQQKEHLKFKLRQLQ
jgi:ribosome-binding ATPase YchF (GTP1/OBG family)